MPQNNFISLALSKPVTTGALKIALVVGTLLAVINHGDKFIAMSLSAEDTLKVILSYIVPYCVSTWSAVQAIKNRS